MIQPELDRLSFVTRAENQSDTNVFEPGACPHPPSTYCAESRTLERRTRRDC